jgi:CubicO group peptidase (beta-lactamase class C family)
LFAPQGGLRISARGLARIGRMLLNGGTIDEVRILSSQAVDTLLAQTWHFNGSNGKTTAASIAALKRQRHAPATEQNARLPR